MVIQIVMQEKRKIMVVRLIGLLTLATGLYEIRPVWQPHVHMWLHLRSYVYCWGRLPELFGIVGTYSAILVILAQSTLIAKLIVVYGLFRVRSWGRPAAMVVLTADFVLRANVAITMFLLTALVPPTPPPPMPEGGVTMTIFMWPSYLIAIISIVSVLVLIQKPIKNLFAKSKSLSENLA